MNRPSLSEQISTAAEAAQKAVSSLPSLRDMALISALAAAACRDRSDVDDDDQDVVGGGIEVVDTGDTENNEGDADADADSDTDTDSDADTDTDSDTDLDPNDPTKPGTAAYCRDLYEKFIPTDSSNLADDVTMISRGAQSSLEAGVFRDSNFEATGDTSDLVACTWDEEGNAADYTSLYEEGGRYTVVGTGLYPNNAIALAFLDSETEQWVPQSEDSSLVFWLYSVEGENIIDTSY